MDIFYFFKLLNLNIIKNLILKMYRYKYIFGLYISSFAGMIIYK